MSLRFEMAEDVSRFKKHNRENYACDSHCLSLTSGSTDKSCQKASFHFSLSRPFNVKY